MKQLMIISLLITVFTAGLITTVTQSAVNADPRTTTKEVLKPASGNGRCPSHVLNCRETVTIGTHTNHWYKLQTVTRIKQPPQCIELQFGQKSCATETITSRCCRVSSSCEGRDNCGHSNPGYIFDSANHRPAERFYEWSGSVKRLETVPVSHSHTKICPGGERVNENASCPKVVESTPQPTSTPRPTVSPSNSQPISNPRYQRPSNPQPTSTPRPTVSPSNPQTTPTPRQTVSPSNPQTTPTSRPSVLVAPGGVRVECSEPSAGQTRSRLTVRWGSVSGAERYEVSVKAAGTPRIRSLPASRTLTVFDVEPGVTYTVRVRAVSRQLQVKSSAWSADQVVECVRFLNPVVLPTVPAGDCSSPSLPVARAKATEVAGSKKFKFRSWTPVASQAASRVLQNIPGESEAEYLLAASLLRGREKLDHDSLMWLTEDSDSRDGFSWSFIENNCGWELKQIGVGFAELLYDNDVDHGLAGSRPLPLTVPAGNGDRWWPEWRRAVDQWDNTSAEAKPRWSEWHQRGEFRRSGFAGDNPTGLLATTGFGGRVADIGDVCSPKSVPYSKSDRIAHSGSFSRSGYDYCYWFVPRDGFWQWWVGNC